MGHPAFNPFSYHLGSVWPVENGTFVLGFGRYGCFDELVRLAEGFFALSDLFVANRLPEAVEGLQRDEAHPHSGIYPHSNELQGWSGSAVVFVIQMLLGMYPVTPLGTLFLHPTLPPWLPDLRLSGVHVGRALVDIEAWRTEDGKSHFRVKQRQGRLLVLPQPPPNASGTSPIWRTLVELAPFG